MAVYTHIDQDELEAFLATLGFGAVVSFEGIAQGVENTNYRVVAEDRAGGVQTVIVTIFEKRVAEADIPFFLNAMAHFAARGLPTPEPFADARGEAVGRLRNKPAVAISFLDGAPRMAPTPDDCAAFGAALAQMHIAGASAREERANDLSLGGWRRLASACSRGPTRTPADLAPLIVRELDVLAREWPSGLPRGLIHADAFPDNVFFDESGEISGVIDFYFACTDYFSYDLAIALNAWASSAGSGSVGRWLANNARSMLAGYQEVRPLSPAERRALPLLLRGAALRFLLTRLYDTLNQTPGAVVAVKDPYEYARLIETHAEGRADLF